MSIKVFVSATSVVLASARQTVKEALLSRGIHPVEQTHFPPDYRKLTEVLRAIVHECQAVVHIVGFRYGTEPKQRDKFAPRRSYAQMEYHMAAELNRPVYVFLCGEDFPFDDLTPETDVVCRELQIQHRSTISASGRHYTRVSSHDELEKAVLKTRFASGRASSLQLNKYGCSVMIYALCAVFLFAMYFLVMPPVAGPGMKTAQVTLDLSFPSGGSILRGGQPSKHSIRSKYIVESPKLREDLRETAIELDEHAQIHTGVSHEDARQIIERLKNAARELNTLGEHKEAEDAARHALWLTQEPDTGIVKIYAVALICTGVKKEDVRAMIEAARTAPPPALKAFVDESVKSPSR
jgi:hypothetical protein